MKFSLVELSYIELKQKMLSDSRYVWKIPFVAIYQFGFIMDH
jgi:hypothetical protein